MGRQYPRIMIAGTHSGVGKSTISTGIMQCLTDRGYPVQGFKAGPDYIDPSYHTYVTGWVSRNLDSFLLGQEGLVELFFRQALDVRLSVIEGVMGLFDGLDGKTDKGSTAEIAKVLKTPVILVLDCRSMSGSAAAIVKGFSEFDPGLKIKGIILNQVGSSDHERMLREALVNLKIPVIGAVPRGALPKLPERHLGLVPMMEKGVSRETFQQLSQIVANYLDFGLLLRIAGEAEPLVKRGFSDEIFSQAAEKLFNGARVGYAWDEAFSFYYRDALDYLEHLGALLIPFSPLHDRQLPLDLDGLIIGGGFPELYAGELSQNHSMLLEITEFAHKGKPIYAECGGLMYLTLEIIDFDGNSFAQVGLIPARTVMRKKLSALGYYRGQSIQKSILGPKGIELKGHEFHYSVLEKLENYPPAAKLSKLSGDEKPDGYCQGSVYASYLHQHWAGQREAAQAFLKNCLEQKRGG